MVIVLFKSTRRGTLPAGNFRKDYGCRIAAHTLDARAIEEGDTSKTGSDLYGIRFPPTRVDQVLEGKEMRFDFEGGFLHFLYGPYDGMHIL